MSQTLTREEIVRLELDWSVNGTGGEGALRSVPSRVDHPPAVADWLYLMWGYRAGREWSTRTAPSVVNYPPGIAEWLYRMWGVVGQDGQRPQ